MIKEYSNAITRCSEHIPKTHSQVTARVAESRQGLRNPGGSHGHVGRGKGGFDLARTQAVGELLPKISWTVRSEVPPLQSADGPKGLARRIIGESQALRTQL